jgi:uncharacterized repeat protein (TIGR01451 family)
VFFGPEPGKLSSVTGTEIVLQVTTNARTGPLTLIAPGGSFVTTNTFTVLPRILDFQPRLGPVGTVVAITGTSFFNVTNVAFNGVSATNTVISPQQILATVPLLATTGFVRVGTLDGESFSPIAFTVTTPGDLRVSEILSTNLVAPGQTVVYTTTVTNLGPSIQSGVTLTNSLPTELVVQSAVPTQGGCGINGDVVSCALGVITNARSAAVTITVNVPVSGVFTNTATVTSIEGDTLSANNTLKSVLVAASVAQRTLSIQLLSAPNRAVVSWPTSFVPFGLQSISELGNTNVPWQNVLTSPAIVNGTNRLTNANPAAAQEFFRLRYP